MSRVVNSRLFLALILALPALPMIFGLPDVAAGNQKPDFLYHVSGEWAARFLILALAASPLMAIFPGTRFPRWLIQRRRWIGMASFLYVCLHGVVYLGQQPNVATVLRDFGDPGIAVGWIGFALMVPLAGTSCDAAMRLLGGRRWKIIQRCSYVIAIAAALHWILVAGHAGPVVVHFGLLVLLEAGRVLVPRIRRQPCST